MSGRTIPYSFSVLRYVHDTVTEEFLNVGVVVYSQSARYLRIRCSESYSRLTRTFAGTVRGKHYKSLIHRIDRAVIELAEGFVSPGLQRIPESVVEVTPLIIPPDDSALQFSAAGGGLSSDLDGTLEGLFERYVERYSKRELKDARSDVQILTAFRAALRGRHIVEYIQRPKRIVSKHWEHEFPWSWRNGVWTVCEPVSLDLIEGESIVDKAHRWEGRINSLMEGNPDFHSYLLLGEPSNLDLRSAYDDARAILERLPEHHRAVPESEAADFGDQIQDEIPR